MKATFADDAGNAEELESDATVAVAPPPLTAEFLSAPAAHDGSRTCTMDRDAENGERK